MIHKYILQKSIQHHFFLWGVVNCEKLLFIGLQRNGTCVKFTFYLKRKKKHCRTDTDKRKES